MKKAFLLIVLMLFFGCDIMKKSQKTKDRSQYVEQVKTETIRKGDTITYTVLNPILKDTIITKFNTVTGTTLKMQYDQQGKLDLTCISSEINELREEIRSANMDKIEKEKEKTEDFDSKTILYFMFGLAGIFVLGLVFVGIMVSRYASSVNKVLERL